MARHEVVIHENTSATHDVAPYTGSYISKETVALAEFAAAVGAKCGLPAIQVIAIIGGAFDAIAALEREALVRVSGKLASATASSRIVRLLSLCGCAGARRVRGFAEGVAPHTFVALLTGTAPYVIMHNSFRT